MSSLGLPVPPGFTITTEVCTHYYDNKNTYPQELKDEVEKALAVVEKIVGAEASVRPTIRCWSRCAPVHGPRCRA